METHRLSLPLDALNKVSAAMFVQRIITNQYSKVSCLNYFGKAYYDTTFLCGEIFILFSALSSKKFMFKFMLA